MATQWNKCLMELEGSGAVALWPMASPRVRMVEIVSSVEPPKVSITNGINSTPTKWQADRWEVSLCLVPTWRAWLEVEATSLSVCCWRGRRWHVHPRQRDVHHSNWGGKYQLAWRGSWASGWESPLINGARAADWAAQKLCPGWHCVGRSDHCCRHNPPDDLHICQQCCGILGRSSSYCEMKPQANIVDSSETLGPEGGGPKQQKGLDSASRQH